MTTPATDERNDALKPYLDKLCSLGPARTDPDVPLRINVGGESFQVEPWERDAVLQSLEDPQSRGTQRWRSLLARGVALRAKTLSDVHKLAKRGGSDERLLSELRLDATIGFALTEELQRAVDQAVVAGDMEHANRLTQFRNKLARSIDDLESHLGSEVLGETKLIAEDLVALPDHRRASGKRKPSTPPGEDRESGESADSARIAALVKLEEELLKQQPERQAVEPKVARRAPEPKIAGAAARPRASRAGIMVAVLAALLAAWLWLVAWPAYQRSQTQTLSAADFPDMPQITHVVARPPSLFVTVDEDAWAALPPAKRLDLVEALGRRLSVTGYSGAHVKDTEGRTVAQWLKSAGAKLVGSDS